MAVELAAYRRLRGGDHAGRGPAGRLWPGAHAGPQAAKSWASAIFLTYLVPPTLLFLPLSRVVAVLGLQNSLWSLVVVYPTFTIPFCTWLLMGFFKSVPREIEEAAIVDGCSLFGAFVKMVLPLSVPAILTVVIFAFTLTVQEFVYALTFISSSDQKPVTFGSVDRFDPRRHVLLGRDDGRGADRQRAGGDRLQSLPGPLHHRHHRRRGQIGSISVSVGKTDPAINFRGPQTGSGRRGANFQTAPGIGDLTFHDLQGDGRRSARHCRGVPQFATFTGHNLKDVEAILDAH